MAEALHDLTPHNDLYLCNGFIKSNYVVVSINHLVGDLRKIKVTSLQMSLETQGQIKSMLDDVLRTKIVVFF